jgi:mono/diheme cytochrome c family protein
VAYQAELYHKTAAEAGRVMSNPLKGDLVNRSKHLAEGKKLFGIYCALCHGSKGKGNGTIPGRDNYPKPPDFTFGDRYKNEADGFYYHTIVFGKDKVPGYTYKSGEEPKGNMPGYGHAITSKVERWQLVMYIRQLQGLYGNEAK